MKDIFVQIFGKQYSFDFIFFVLEILFCVGAENKIKCIKLLRSWSIFADGQDASMGLKEAKDVIEWATENKPVLAAIQQQSRNLLFEKTQVLEHDYTENRI
jgi:hypothetical protein